MLNEINDLVEDSKSVARVMNYNFNFICSTCDSDRQFTGGLKQKQKKMVRHLDVTQLHMFKIIVFTDTTDGICHSSTTCQMLWMSKMYHH